MNQVAALQEMISDSRNIVFFGGAGVSTESGIPDFRSVDGLYHQQFQYPPETMLSHSFFLSHTEEFFDFYRKKMICPTATPNPAHLKLAELERAGKLRAIVTQNIDNLHQLGGAKRVLELHGSVFRNHCMDCSQFYDLDFVMERRGVPRCTRCSGIVKPDVVLYEEPLDMSVMSAAVEAIEQADMLIIGGTSLVVYPAAGLIRYFKGDRLVVINKAATEYDNRAALSISRPIGQVLSQIAV
jgi:NAD-dependent deacetylase